MHKSFWGLQQGCFPCPICKSASNCLLSSLQTVPTALTYLEKEIDALIFQHATDFKIPSNLEDKLFIFMQFIEQRIKLIDLKGAKDFFLGQQQPGLLEYRNFQAKISNPYDYMTKEEPNCQNSTIKNQTKTLPSPKPTDFQIQLSKLETKLWKKLSEADIMKQLIKGFIGKRNEAFIFLHKFFSKISTFVINYEEVFAHMVKLAIEVSKKKSIAVSLALNRQKVQLMLRTLPKDFEEYEQLVKSNPLLQHTYENAQQSFLIKLAAIISLIPTKSYANRSSLPFNKRGKSGKSRLLSSVQGSQLSTQLSQNKTEGVQLDPRKYFELEKENKRYYTERNTKNEPIFMAEQYIEDFISLHIESIRQANQDEIKIIFKNLEPVSLQLNLIRNEVMQHFEKKIEGFAKEYLIGASTIKSEKTAKQKTIPLHYFLETRDYKFEFIHLPQRLADLIRSKGHQKKSSCKLGHNQYTSICLLCGELACKYKNCSIDSLQMLDVFAHTFKCGGGSTIYLSIDNGEVRYCDRNNEYFVDLAYYTKLGENHNNPSKENGQLYREFYCNDKYGGKSVINKYRDKLLYQTNQNIYQKINKQRY